jgi:tRNA threonylcarbamoyl adenosine modification protein YeaZ
LIILALDTTTEVASVALRRDSETVSEEVIATNDGHSYLIFQMVQTVLSRAKMQLSLVDCFASAIGPGSFTGVRICLAAVKGMAHAMGKPASGISNLRALATFGTAKLRTPIIDARRGQIYTAIYDSDLTLVSEEIVVPAEQWQVAGDVERITEPHPLASAIARCAEMDGPAKWRDPALLDANYVRRADADSLWIDAGSRL